MVYDIRLAIARDPAAPQAAERFLHRDERRTIARFSRAVGLPRPLPDLLGLSLRVLDAYGIGLHQDLLLVTSADYPLMHHIFLRALDFQQRPYTRHPLTAPTTSCSSSLRAQVRSPHPHGGSEFERLDTGASTSRLAFDIAVAAIAGRFRALGSVHIGRRLPHQLDALRFNPWNTGGGMEPTGWLNGARDRAYRLSQSAWRRARRDGAALRGLRAT